MKKNWKLAVAAVACFAFTACADQNNAATETETIEADEPAMEQDLNTAPEADTAMIEDTTVNDGVVDEIPEEQPPQ